MSVPQTANLADAGEAGLNFADQSLLRIKYQSLLSDLSRGPVAVRPGGVSADLMAELTRASRCEVGLVRAGGERYLVIGDAKSIDLSWADRVIAHTHPSGDLRFSDFGAEGGDIPSFRLYQPGQRSSVLIGPDGTAVRLPIPRN